MTQPITFSVVSSTLTSTTLELDGSTTFESLPIETLTFRHSTILPLGGKFLKTASAATINVSLTDYTNLGNEAVPFSLTLNIDDPGDGYIYVRSVGYPGMLPAHAKPVSETKGLLAPAQRAAQRAHEASVEILKELRRVNESVGTIQRIFAETHENQQTLSPTGTDHG
jgi:hypothetical protein